MRPKHLIAAAATAALAVTGAAAAPALAGDKPTLADVLLADSKWDDANGFDHNAFDYDIVTQAVLAFPDLTEAASDPAASLTVFLPRDAAFKRLVRDITGTRPKTEKETFDAVVGLGLDTVKTVLTYHIVGAKISYRDALRSNGATLETLQGGTLGVRTFGPFVRLKDADTDDRNPFVVQPNVGGMAANGFAHGIDRVLRPIDLP